ncbi:MAG TPA: protein kinase, partial [Gemmataceae bacterium]|nr:protein kinase [Gemmataceae bacterium]
MQAASGLAAAHAQGLVHRDIKPANILLENGIERVKITDFGLARATDDARVTQSGVVTGTPQYMSPEQASGKPVDHRADLFSLGGVLYAMCTGYAPFRASSSMAVMKKVCDETPRPIKDLNPEIPDWLAAIVEKLMAKDPKDRFQSAQEVASLLGQHLAHLQQPAVFPEPPGVARPKAAVAVPEGPPPPRWLLPALLASIIVPFLLNTALFTGWIPNDGAFRSTGAKVGLIACEAIIFFVLLMMHLVADKRSLTIPALLIVAPFIAVPLLLYAGFAHGDIFGTEIGKAPFVIMCLVLGAVCAILGLVLLMTRLARRGSQAWVFVLVSLVLLLLASPIALLCAGLGFPVLQKQQDSIGSGGDQPTNPETQRELPRTHPQVVSAPDYRLPSVPPGPPMEGSKPTENNESVIKRFDPKADKPITSEAFGSKVTEDEGGWRIQHQNSDKNQPLVLAAPSIPLFEIPRPAIAGCRVTVRAQVKTEGKDPFSQACLEVDCGNAGVAKLGAVRSGTTTLATYEIFWKEFPDINPEAFKINARLAWNATIWIKDLEVIIARPPGSAPVVPPAVMPTQPLPAKETLLKKFDPKTDKPIQIDFGGKRVSVEDDSWRIDSTSDRHDVGPKYDLKLFELPKQNLQNSTVILRFKMRSGDKPTGACVLPMLGYPAGWYGGVGTQLGRVFDYYSGTADWKNCEVKRSYTGTEPTDITILVDLDRPGTIWIKDLEIIKMPLLPASPSSSASATAGTKETVLKKFDPKTDKPISKEVLGRQVTEEEGGWRIQYQNHDAQPSLDAGPNVPLFEIARPAVKGRRVTLRAQVKTEGKDIPSAACLEIDPGELAKRSLGAARLGTTNWALYEITLDCPPDSDPPSIKIGARIMFSGSIWIKDLELVTTPLPGPAAPPPVPASNPPPAKETVLKKFDPKTDKPFQIELADRHVTIEGDAWRMDAKKDPPSGPGFFIVAPNIKLFELPKQNIQQSTVVLRFKMKSEKLTSNARVGLWFGGQPISHYRPEDPDVIGTTDWKDYAVSNLCKDSGPADIAIFANIGGTGTIWLKDIELVKSPLPTPASPPPAAGGTPPAKESIL